ncbi:PAS domain-containing protein [Deinococcus psychrotolerans]|uniref:histidine kinase n=1 Tax=Deinococcus psychrotolerans TaxID=2489213 RepID=A0A3G8YLZ8_9DEIO|nr:ATP-binding protein [Deinococcus psychrotolerans]AZI43614.1 PAS domain-containing protein [Deinococcus psychrotolerans]
MSDQQSTPAPVWSSDDLRRQAEEQLQAQPSQHSEANFQHLRHDFEAQQHELQVHQVELLLQNEELQRSNQALELARDKYQELYDMAPVGYFSLDKGGHIVEVNAAGSAQLGLSRPHLLGRRFLLFVDESSRTSLATLLKRLGSGAASGRGRLELRLLPQSAGGAGAGGPTVPLEGQLDAVLSSGGDIRLAITDITALKAAQSTILALNDTLETRIVARTVQVQELNEELELFVQSTMQALDTPLRHISSFAGLLKHAQPAATPAPTAAASPAPQDTQTVYPEALREHYLREMVSAAEHVQVLAAALTEYFRLGRQRARFIPVSLEKVLAEVKKSLAGELEGRQIVWEQHRLPTVTGDSRTLQLLFFHLLDNALKFSETRSEVRICIGVSENNTEYIISVQDNGVGFNMRQKSRLFALFQQLHSPRQFRGLGLGLAVVKRVVLRHGGRVWGEGKEGEGASFWVALPKEAGVRR